MDNNHDQFMLQAIEEAKKAKTHGDWPFGAVVVKDGKIVGQGHATDKSGGVVTDHAELIALDDACRSLKTNNLEGCSIYCTNEPCLMCAAGIFQAKIGEVFIGVSRSDLPHLLRQRKFGIDDLAQDSGYKINIVRGILKEKILQLFEDIKK